MARTLRRSRDWQSVDENGPHAHWWGQNVAYIWVRDGKQRGHTEGMRRRKRNSLRAWRHQQRIRLVKGQEVEGYTMEWLD